MTHSQRNHYQTERWDMDGRIWERRCFETSQGAVAYLVGASGGASTFKVYVLTHATCTVCNPTAKAS